MIQLYIQLTAKIVFCKPNGIGVSLVNKTTLNACGPEITRSIARAVSLCNRAGKLDDKLDDTLPSIK